MEGATEIPMMKSPANVMEAGPNGNNLATAASRVHPVDQLQRAEAGTFFRFGASSSMYSCLFYACFNY